MVQLTDRVAPRIVQLFLRGYLGIVGADNRRWQPFEDGVDERPRKLDRFLRFQQGWLPGRAGISKPRGILRQSRDVSHCWGERAIYPCAQFAQLLQIVGLPKGRVVPRKESLHRLLDHLLTVKQSVPDKGRTCRQIMLRIVQVFLGAQEPFPGVRDKHRVRLHTAVSLPERWWMEMTPSGATAW